MRYVIKHEVFVNKSGVLSLKFSVILFINVERKQTNATKLKKWMIEYRLI